MISHPFMTLAQTRDPPRVPSVQQYDTFVEPDVHHPGNAVVIYFFGILCLVFSILFYC